LVLGQQSDAGDAMQYEMYEMHTSWNGALCALDSLTSKATQQAFGTSRGQGTTNERKIETLTTTLIASVPKQVRSWFLAGSICGQL